MMKNWKNTLLPMVTRLRTIKYAMYAYMSLKALAFSGGLA